ncbi:MAG: ABC transporter ATP-binding protein [Candidatus Binataceae bacterium]|jgi:iron complex transport system ATP-binding protein
MIDTPATSGPALVARDLVAGYGKRQVLNGVSLEVGAGEMMAVLGPNGAGKSTLLNLLGGALRPWRGSIEVLGRAIEDFDRRALARVMASVRQESGAAFPFTVLEVVLMGRAPHLGPLRFEGKQDLAIARAALERFGLIPLAGRFVQELSGGERRRVFIARALAQEPAIALLDEPTAFLDLKHIGEIFAMLKQLRAERRMAVIATFHDLNVAAQYADRVLLLKDGAAIGWGTPEEVLTAENLRRVYETEVYVGHNPATGAITVLSAAR